jgi:hypothetical protein
MQLDATLRRLLLIFTLLCLPFMVGSSCIVLFNSSGGSSNNDKEEEEEEQEQEQDTVVIVKSGSFNAPVVEGLNYESGTLSGVTGANGEFQYEDGSTIQFAIGDIKLGAAAAGKTTITPQDLVVDDARNETAALNLARLLFSLDSDQTDNMITIPGFARAKAVRSNPSITAAIDFMDYADEQSFVNSASQLIATLTEDYPFTTTVIETENARGRLLKLRNNGEGQ